MIFLPPLYSKRTTGRKMYPSLFQWITSNGGNCSNVSISTTTKAGRGLYATKDIEKNAVIFSVPISCMITETLVKDSIQGRITSFFGQRNGFQIPSRILMSIYLMVENAKLEVEKEKKKENDEKNEENTKEKETVLQTKSFFQHYIPSLPSHYGTPTFVSETMDTNHHQMAALKGTPVGIRESERVQMMKNTYNAILPKLIELHPTIFIPKYCSFRYYLWAHTSICTRLFPSSFLINEQETNTGIPPLPSDEIDPCGIMMPIGDMLNHSFHHNVIWKTTSMSPNGSESDADSLSLEIQCISLSTIHEGDEILFNYGHHSNGRCFITYGFCQPNNPYNVVPIHIVNNSSSSDGTTLGNFGRSGMVSAAVERLVNASLLQNGQGINDVVVPSITRSESKVMDSTLWKAFHTIVNGNSTGSDDNSYLYTVIETYILMLHVVRTLLIDERKNVESKLSIYKSKLSKPTAAAAATTTTSASTTTTTTTSSSIDSNEHYTNVELYLRGSIESLEWTITLIKKELHEIGKTMSMNELDRISTLLEKRESWLDEPLRSKQTLHLLGRTEGGTSTNNEETAKEQPRTKRQKLQ
jgi:hypothetical protein